MKRKNYLGTYLLFLDNESEEDEVKLSLYEP
jgi:hypothetical protein